jgi:peptidoglycan/LPS O-acetylase OafA/YrhL
LEFIIKGTYRADIDGLRAIAAIGVLLFHAGVTATNGGLVGTNIFFVISGYLITTILMKEQDQNGKIDFRSF